MRANHVEWGISRGRESEAITPRTSDALEIALRRFARSVSNSSSPPFTKRDLLIAIGDQVLSAFPTLRDKYKKLIQDGVQAAEDKVNKLADKLKKGIVALLDSLGKALDACLGLPEKAYMAAVDAVAKFVQAPPNRNRIASSSRI